MNRNLNDMIYENLNGFIDRLPEMTNFQIDFRNWNSLISFASLKKGLEKTSSAKQTNQRYDVKKGKGDEDGVLRYRFTM